MNRLFLLLFGAITFVAHAQVPAYVPTDGLVAWYPFNGNANDESGNGNVGEPIGASLTENRVGALNSAYLFDGSNDYIDFGNVEETNALDEFTIAGWFNSDDLSHWRTLISKGAWNDAFTNPGWAILVTNNQMNLYLNGEWNLYTPLEIPTNEWHFFSFSRDENNEFSVIYDGLVVNSGVVSDIVPGPNNNTLKIGKNDGYNANNGNFPYPYHFSGALDDYGFWNRALTEEEILALYNAPAPSPGCTDSTACNFDSDATSDDGSCIPSGCMDPTACNYSALAECEGEVCDYSCCPAPECCDDVDGDGVCDEFEVAGCVDVEACNYDANATDDDGSCIFLEPGYDCEGNCLEDSDGDGVCDEFEVVGCQSEEACNFNPAATDSGECYYLYVESGCGGNCVFCGDELVSDSDGDGVCNPDEVCGCTDPSACNYNVEATNDDGSCIFPEPGFPEPGYDCEGNCLEDSDGDGVCDEFEVVGCQTEEACNFDPAATDSGECWYYLYVESGCGGNCVFCGDELVSDSDGDGVCNPDEVCGCTDPSACNYNDEATHDDGSCTYSVGSCFDCSGEFIMTFGPCLAVFEEPIEGCWDGNACNYSSCWELEGYLPCGMVTWNCIYPPGDLTCEEWYELDSDNDGIADPDEILGCTYQAANNYNVEATEDDGSCYFIDPECETLSGNSQEWEVVCLFDVNQNGICDCYEPDGCTDSTACNYNPDIGLDDGSCVYPQDFFDCDGICLSDGDSDGVCDEMEINGCIDPSAINFLGLATDEGPCYYPSDFFDSACEEELTAIESQLINGGFCAEGTLWSPALQMCIPDPVCIGDLSGDGVVGTNDLLQLLSVFGGNCVITGCTLPFALNYVPDAEVDDLSCAIVGCSDPLALNYLPSVNVAQDDLCTYGVETSTGACLGLDQINFNGYSYPLVEIGSHCWFKENLRTTQFADSTAILFSNEGDSWGVDTIPVGTYPGGSSLVAATFGLLYNWHSVIDERGICPVGWHPADSSAWNEVISIAGGAATGALNMKVPGTQENGLGVWAMDNEFSSNATGFSGIPAGYRLPNGNYGGLYATGQFWGGESLTLTNARSYYLNQSLESVGITQNNKQLGLSVRCVQQPMTGCTDSAACNYNPDAELDSGTCNYPELGLIGCECFEFCEGEAMWVSVGCDQLELVGCTDAIACNYDPEACDDDGSCTYAEEGLDCDGNCLVDFDGDGLCYEVLGCQDETACNFSADATEDDGSCLQFDECGVCGGDGIAEGACDCDGNFPAMGYDCDGNCLNDADGDGVCCEFEQGGCKNESACNYDPWACDDDGSCVWLDECGVCGGDGIAEGACDCDGNVPEAGLDCDGNCINDADNDGCCLCFGEEGCTDVWACNFDAYATDDDGSCVYATGCETCSGEIDGTGIIVDNDADDDGVCDADEVAGCQDDTACNYNEYATDPDVCNYATACEECSSETDGTGMVISFDVVFDGYTYDLVAIGDQCWFAENLRTEHYANGDAIPGELTNSEWSNAGDTNLGAQAVYNNDASNLADYGRLYNWYAVDDARSLCPSGWHVPTDGEYMTVEMALGMSESEANTTGWRGTDQGTQMKSSPSDDPSWDGTNTSGFSALAGGYRNSNGYFGNGGNSGSFWSSSPNGTLAWRRKLDSGLAGVYRSSNNQRLGFSVRCVRDE